MAAFTAAELALAGKLIFESPQTDEFLKHNLPIVMAKSDMGGTGGVGPTGAAGPKGATGVAGSKGATGTAGVAGVTGAKGVTGPTGTGTPRTRAYITPGGSTGSSTADDTLIETVGLTTGATAPAYKFTFTNQKIVGGTHAYTAIIQMSAEEGTNTTPTIVKLGAVDRTAHTAQIEIDNMEPIFGGTSPLNGTFKFNVSIF